MTSITTLIVGAHFRPPAKQVLAVLPTGAKLVLRPERDNPYDPNAIRVFVLTAGIPASQHETLDRMLEGTGTILPDLLDGAELFVGFVPNSDGPIPSREGVPGNRHVHDLAISANGGEPDWTELVGTLSFAPNAKGDTSPWVTVQDSSGS